MSTDDRKDFTWEDAQRAIDRYAQLKKFVEQIKEDRVAKLEADKAELLAALKASEEIIAALIGMYGDSGAGIVLRQVRAAIAKVSK